MHRTALAKYSKMLPWHQLLLLCLDLRMVARSQGKHRELRTKMFAPFQLVVHMRR